MAILIINTGTSANAGNGDSIRTAFDKVNRNFNFLNGIVIGSSTNFTSGVQDIVRPMLDHDRHIGITSGYDSESKEIIFYFDGDTDNLTVKNLTTLKDAIITGTLTVGALSGADDVNIVKNATDGSLNFSIKNTFITGTSQINILDATTGSFNIVHQNFGANTALFLSGQNYIYDDRGGAINIGRNSDLNFYSNNTWSSYSSLPALAIKNTGTIDILNDNFNIGGRNFKVSATSIVIDGLEIANRSNRIEAGVFSAVITTSGNIVLPGDAIIRYTAPIVEGQTILATGVSFSEDSPFPGSGSIYFDGSSRIEVVGGNNFSFTTGSYTIEWFQKPTVYSPDEQYTAFILGTLDDQAIQGITFTSGGTTVTSFVLEGAFQVVAPYTGDYLNTWTHIAIARTTSSIAVYINGQRTLNTASNFFPTPVPSFDNLVIGSSEIYGSYLNSFTGFISNMKWSDSIVYSNASFTPPSSPLTPDSNTRLLLNAASSSTFLIDTSGTAPRVPQKLSFVLNTSSMVLDDVGNLSFELSDVSTWTFGTDGYLEFPDNTQQTTAYTGIAPAASTSTDSTNIGYMGIPQNRRNAGYTLSLSDQGRHIYCTGTNFTVTVPANTTTSFPIGSSVMIVTGPTTTVTVQIETDTLYLAGTTSTGTRTVDPISIASLIKIDTNTWYISGTGVV